MKPPSPPMDLQKGLTDLSQNEMKPNNRDWTEDFVYENGKYSNTCICCKKEFIGHKRRCICKKCANKKSWFKSLIDKVKELLK